jgi:hypothetical protein
MSDSSSNRASLVLETYLTLGTRFRKANYLSPEMLFDKSNEWPAISKKNFSGELLVFYNP